MRSKLTCFIVSLLIIFLLSACNTSSGPSSQGSYSINPIFADFYREFGGENTLGAAISSSFSNEGLTYQYVVAGLMVYDPQQIPIKRYHFALIASTELRINGLVERAPTDGNKYYINGHQIWEEVWSFFDRYGTDIIGLPVSSVVANDVKQRYEQYFDGIGFYRNYSDPPGQVHLMPYGSWMCGSECRYRVSDATPPPASYTRDFSATEGLFLQASERLGYGFTGAPLAAPRLGSDGNYEMVFENVVLYIDPTNGSQIRLRPLPSWVGIRSEQAVQAVKADWLYFFQIQEGLGFNVPISFMEYINNQGGSGYTGDPITEYRSVTDGGYSQCFTNVCLEYHPTAPKELQIRPHSLGAEYLAMGARPSTPSADITDALQINAWEEHPLIPSGQAQVIHIEATQKGVPVSGIQFSLVVKQPDGVEVTYSLDPTGGDGKTSLKLNPINGPNGAIIQYEVCVIGATAPQICFSRSYTIWNQ